MVGGGGLASLAGTDPDKAAHAERHERQGCQVSAAPEPDWCCDGQMRGIVYISDTFTASQGTQRQQKLGWREGDWTDGSLTKEATQFQLVSAQTEKQ